MAPPPPAGFEPFGHAGEFIALVGPVFARGDGTERVLGLRIEERHRNAGGAAHGGLLATLIDFALGRPINSDEEVERAVTVSLTTDFLGPAAVGDWVQAHTEVEHLGGKLAFADCSLTVEGRTAPRRTRISRCASRRSRGGSRAARAPTRAR